MTLSITKTRTTAIAPIGPVPYSDPNNAGGIVANANPMYGMKLKTKSRTSHSKAKSMPAATRKIVAGIAIKAFTLVRMTQEFHRSCLTASNGANTGVRVDVVRELCRTEPRKGEQEKDEQRNQDNQLQDRTADGV